MIGASGVGGAGAVERRAEEGLFLAAAVAGLSRPRKALSPRWLYDARGSALHELVCEQQEHYPYRTELAILRAHAAELGEAIGSGALVFEYGAGNARRTARLLAALRAPAGYVPVDASPEALLAAAEALEQRHPGLDVRPLVADFTGPLELPPLPCRRRVSFFPGSTIGSFDPPEAVALLAKMGREAGPGGALVVGVDLPKDEATLVAAYDDARGVTAAFHLNLLARMNRELGADFRLSRFRHRAIWDPGRSRVEMHLESCEDQVVQVSGIPFAFRAGETVHTENAYKWEPHAFDALAHFAGWRLERDWADERAWFSVRLYTRG